MGKVNHQVSKKDYDKLYMSDVEYVKLLEKVAETVNTPGFYPNFEDSNAEGCKYTWSNCGLCNDMDNGTWTTKENALFPEQLPSRKSFKYFQKHQLCPFDQRNDEDMKGMKGMQGCFYMCYLFKSATIDIEKIREMAKNRLDKMKPVCTSRMAHETANFPLVD